MLDCWRVWWFGQVDDALWVNNEADRCFSLVEFRSSSCMAKMTFLTGITNISDDTEDTGKRNESVQ